MNVRPFLLRQLRNSRRYLVQPSRVRCLATKPTPESTSSSTPETEAPAQSTSWLTQKVRTSPAFAKVFFAFTGALGYGSPKQLAGRRALGLYEHLCAVKPDEDRVFWIKDCDMPATFQSWFTVTNLHIWMLTVRLRALPAPHGKYYTQALLDHFFLDIEDRIRAVLQPPQKPIKPYTFLSDFYVNPNAPVPDGKTLSGKPQPILRAPDRLVTQQMKIFKEQWAGMGMSFDLGLVKGDMEMAGAVWRNVLGARGANGIAYPDPSAPKVASSPKFRRAVNLVGGEIVNVAKLDLEKEELKDDGSGVHDFSPEDADKYIKYPELMLDLVGYVRRELARLEKLSDQELMLGDWEKFKFGNVAKVNPR